MPDAYEGERETTNERATDGEVRFNSKKRVVNNKNISHVLFSCHNDECFQKILL